MVRLTGIYTRSGDQGETWLGDRTRVRKTDPRIKAIGAVDELNASIGVVLAAQSLRAKQAEWLLRIQNDLFDVGADLCVPSNEGDPSGRVRVISDYVDWLEKACDQVNAQLPALESFVLPGGSPTAAHLHVARAVCRHAERTALEVSHVNTEIVRYLNRLSDLLFVLARSAATEPEVLWAPGEARS